MSRSRAGRSPGRILTLLITLASLHALPARATSSPDIVISQIYGGGGLANAIWQHDYIELFNRGDHTVSLTGWAVKYNPAGGSSSAWLTTSLSGTIEPGQYYLIEEASTGPNGAPFPFTPDRTGGTIDLSSIAGRVALVDRFVELRNCPSYSQLVDLVGYGMAATCSEGSPTGNLSVRTSASRADGGCADTDDNASDFTVGDPVPRFRVSPRQPCGVSRTIAIHDIQGNDIRSPSEGYRVVTEGIVTGAKAQDSMSRFQGFFIQAPDDEADMNDLTSEGVFVFTRATPPALGTRISVTARVEEFNFASDPEAPTQTELSGIVSIRPISTGNPLPTPVTITAADMDPGGSVYNLEKWEGMRVHVDTLAVSAPSGGRINEPSATATSTGVFFGTIVPIGRPFREVGFPLPDAFPPCPPTPNEIPRFDSNPERLRIDSAGLLGVPPLDYTAGQTVTNFTGPLDTFARSYSLVVDPDLTHMASPPRDTAAVRLPAKDEFTIASFNLQHFYDNVVDGWPGEIVLSAAAYDRRLSKASLVIRTLMRSPDIIGVQEVENLRVLQNLADRVNSDSGPPSPNYQALLPLEGRDISHINVGFLVKRARVEVVRVDQELAIARFSTCEDCLHPMPNCLTPEFLFDRPPLVLRANVRSDPKAKPYGVTVIVNHLRSLIGLTDPRPFVNPDDYDISAGLRVRTKRQSQAEELARLIERTQGATPTEPLFVIGDFNAFPFNDGLVHSIGTIKGLPAGPTQVLHYSPPLVTSPLTNMLDLGFEPANEQYSYTFDGNAQTLDQVLVNSLAVRRATDIAHARCNADFPVTAGSDGSARRLSDHDPAVAFFSFP